MSPFLPLLIKFDKQECPPFCRNFNKGGSLFSFGPGEGDPNLIALGQMEHFTESYMWFFIEWNIQNRGVYYTPEDFFPDGVPW